MKQCSKCDRNIFEISSDPDFKETVWAHEHTGSVYCRYFLTGLEGEELDRAEPK